MNNIDFNQTGGFPLSTNILDAMQSAYGIFNALGNLAGNFAIISGCTLSGTTVSDGVVAMNGEILPFRGGALMASVIIAEDDTNYNFEDGSNKTVIAKRYARFGNSGNAYNWADFKNIFPTTLIQAFKDDFEKRIKKLENATFPIPVGMIAIWNKPSNVAIPTGWQECTDLRGRVPLGWDPNDADFNTVGSNSGSKTKNISKENLPAVGVSYEDLSPGNPDWMGGGFGGGNNHFTRATKTTQPLGSGTAMDVMNPYHIVRFIEYTGN